MKSKPKGLKYRNLYARAGVIYYERVAHGRRIRISTKTNSWDEAASFRDLYEDAKGIGRVPFFGGQVPLFSDFAERYLTEDTAHLAPTTQRDRKSYLREDGPLVRFFGPRRLDEVTPPLLREWWNAEIQARGLSTKTGRSYLDVLTGVLGYAQDLGILESNPVGEFRQTLRRRMRTQRGRAEAAVDRHVRPIEDPQELSRLLEAARAEGQRAYVLVLLLLDAGLRMGEALGLPWGAIAWGQDGDDPSRALLIARSRPRGRALGLTKSGRERRVALSRRLRAALAELYADRFEPGPEELVLGNVDPASFRKREWRRILKRAKLAGRFPKDLRDTFASQLLTAGVQLGYVSLALGHSDVAVTARHYARWAGGDFYRAPMQLEEGEVPADLLARLDEESPQSPPSEFRALRIQSGICVGPPGFEPGRVRL